jgi:hypothetical protein
VAATSANLSSLQVTPPPSSPSILHSASQLVIERRSQLLLCHKMVMLHRSQRIRMEPLHPHKPRLSLSQLPTDLSLLIEDLDLVRIFSQHQQVAGKIFLTTPQDTSLMSSPRQSSPALSPPLLKRSRKQSQDSLLCWLRRISRRIRSPLWK